MSQIPPNAGALVGHKLGKYDILALLALGGTAEIYLARIVGEAGFEKYVVVKCLHDHLADDAEFVRMFRDEARLGAQLAHSNIVHTLELGQEGGRYYMVMEYLAGMSLAMIARKARDRVPGGRLPIEMILSFAAQACAGLHYAHERTSGGRPLHIVHRDISPQNLVVTWDGMLKIVDFGIAKADQRETHTKSGTIKGKFAYMSPEQCLAKHVDRRTDIFALGTIVHELLTGKRLFKRGNTYDTYQAIVAGNVPTPSAVNHELDPSLDALVMRALAYNANDRYASAEAFGEALLAQLHKRGKPTNAAAVSRFFESYFQREIDAHANRMRELISGRSKETMDDLTWDAGEDESGAAARMPDEPLDLDSRPTDGSDIEDEGEATRIELNPLERVRQMHSQVTQDPPRGRSSTQDDTAFQRNKPRPNPPSKPAGLGPGARAGGKAGSDKRTIMYGSAPSPAAIQRGISGPPPSLDRVNKAMAANKRSTMGHQAVPPPSRPNSQSGAGRPPSAHRPASAGAGAPPGAARGPRARSAGAPPSSPRQRAGSAAPDARTMLGEAPPAVKQAVAAQQSSAPSQPPPQISPKAIPPLSAPPAAQPPPSAPQAHAQPQPQPHSAAPAPSPAQPPMSAPQQQSRAQSQAPQAPQPAPSRPPAGKAENFPPINTPTAFRTRAEMISETPPATQPAGGDMSLLASERAAKAGEAPPPWMLAVAFFVSAAIGLGATVLIGKLFA